MIRRMAIFVINIYRRFISPMFPPTCRFTPTCSAYAILAIKKYGILKGIRLTIWRILRCNPWNAGGIDEP